MQGKRCSGCGETKPLDEFHRMSASKDGKQSRCKPCQSGSLRKEYNRQHYAENREHYREVRARWYEEHREEHNARVMERRDPEEHRAYGREYVKRPEVKLRQREKMAVRREGGAYRDTRRLGPFYRKVLDRDGMVCHVCGKPIASLDDLHFDHVVPMAKGGKHTLENVRPAHALCNRRKAARLGH